jgi:hypothetical protein
VGAKKPELLYMQTQIWKTQKDWDASAPFIDRYEIVGNGHAPILLDEFNWWPLAYPLKCKWLVKQDAKLTGPSKDQMGICDVPDQPDLPHPGRYVAYNWIPPREAEDLNRISRHATFANRSLKNGLMDWGFGDAVMALGPMQNIICAGIRELLIKSLQSANVDLAATNAEVPGPEYFFITHSLGSFLSLAALDSSWLGPQGEGVSQFNITPEEKNAADYFSAHTTGFYFLANQIELLELARVSAPEESTNPCPVTAPGTPASSGTPVPASIAHWQCRRQVYLKQRSSQAPGPQIIAWSDPDDLLSWEVPAIEGVRVVNIPVRNSGFKVPPFLVWPTGAHGNYAKNQSILRVILKPTPKM